MLQPPEGSAAAAAYTPLRPTSGYTYTPDTAAPRPKSDAARSSLAAAPSPQGDHDDDYGGYGGRGCVDPDAPTPKLPPPTAPALVATPPAQPPAQPPAEGGLALLN